MTRWLMRILGFLRPHESESAALKELAADHAAQRHSNAAEAASEAARDTRSIATRTKIAAQEAARMVAAGR